MGVLRLDSPEIVKAMEHLTRPRPVLILSRSRELAQLVFRALFPKIETQATLVVVLPAGDKSDFVPKESHPNALIYQEGESPLEGILKDIFRQRAHGFVFPWLSPATCAAFLHGMRTGHDYSSLACFEASTAEEFVEASRKPMANFSKSSEASAEVCIREALMNFLFLEIEGSLSTAPRIRLRKVDSDSRSHNILFAKYPNEQN